MLVHPFCIFCSDGHDTDYLWAGTQFDHPLSFQAKNKYWSTEWVEHMNMRGRINIKSSKGVLQYYFKKKGNYRIQMMLQSPFWEITHIVCWNRTSKSNLETRSEIVLTNNLKIAYPLSGNALGRMTKPIANASAFPLKHEVSTSMCLLRICSSDIIMYGMLLHLQ